MKLKDWLIVASRNWISEIKVEFLLNVYVLSALILLGRIIGIKETLGKYAYVSKTQAKRRNIKV